MNHKLYIQVVDMPYFSYPHLCTIIFYMSIKFCTHYIHKSTHSLTRAHYVYIQANTYSIFLNRAQWVLVYIRRSIVAPLFRFLLNSHSLIWRPSRVADTPPLLPVSRYGYCLFIADVCLCSEVLQPGSSWSSSGSGSM